MPRHENHFAASKDRPSSLSAGCPGFQLRCTQRDLTDTVVKGSSGLGSQLRFLISLATGSVRTPIALYCGSFIFNMAVKAAVRVFETDYGTAFYRDSNFTSREFRIRSVVFCVFFFLWIRIKGCSFVSVQPSQVT